MLPRNDGLQEGSMAIERVKKNLTVIEEREWAHLEKETRIKFQTFWAKVLRRNGYSNVAIAKALGIHESTVRARLKRFMPEP
jgi:DNA-binding NarL/FixJ family response regulator